jgi:hypothetical protein
MSDQVTFRDFAGAIMQNDMSAAAGVLQTLLGLDDAGAATAASYFQQQMATGQEFMMKAMGMRTVVETKDETKLVALLGDCFDLHGVVATSAATTLLARYP